MTPSTEVHTIMGMNKLPAAKRVQILSLLCEGSSMRAVSRLTDTSINTVAKLLVDAGKFCAGFHDDKVRGVKARRVQVDEIWSFTYAKQRTVGTAKAAPDGAGDTWTWTGIDADTKLIVSHFVRERATPPKQPWRLLTLKGRLSRYGRNLRDDVTRHSPALPAPMDQIRRIANRPHVHD